VGSTQISGSARLRSNDSVADNVDAQIFFVARLPRVLAGALVGAGSASAGVVFQALLRNPLAGSVHTRRLGRRLGRARCWPITFGLSIAVGPAVAGAAGKP
jgi:ABC-type enterochelin transport system permease subunit